MRGDRRSEWRWRNGVRLTFCETFCESGRGPALPGDDHCRLPRSEGGEEGQTNDRFISAQSLQELGRIRVANARHCAIAFGAARSATTPLRRGSPPPREEPQANLSQQSAIPDGHSCHPTPPCNPQSAMRTLAIASKEASRLATWVRHHVKRSMPAYGGGMLPARRYGPWPRALSCQRRCGRPAPERPTKPFGVEVRSHAEVRPTRWCGPVCSALPSSSRMPKRPPHRAGDTRLGVLSRPSPLCEEAAASRTICVEPERGLSALQPRLPAGRNRRRHCTILAALA